MTAPTDPVAVADTCLICGRTADQHDMGTGLATCRGIAMPTFRSRARFEALIRADAYAQAAKWLRGDAKLCDCAALEDSECACGAWSDHKTVAMTDLIDRFEREFSTQPANSTDEGLAG